MVIVEAIVYAPFFELFPDIAAKETRNITVLRSGDLPKGTYAFLESFCNDEACDCRRVFVNVYSKGRFGFRGGDPIATISFGWEAESCGTTGCTGRLSTSEASRAARPGSVLGRSLTGTNRARVGRARSTRSVVGPRRKANGARRPRRNEKQRRPAVETTGRWWRSEAHAAPLAELTA